jgi:hypothetical protein
MLLAITQLCARSAQVQTVFPTRINGLLPQLHKACRWSDVTSNSLSMAESLSPVAAWLKQAYAVDMASGGETVMAGLWSKWPMGRRIISANLI